MWSVKQRKPKTRPILYTNVEINKQNFKYTMKRKLKNTESVRIFNINDEK